VSTLKEDSPARPSVAVGGELETGGAPRPRWARWLGVVGGGGAVRERVTGGGGGGRPHPRHGGGDGDGGRSRGARPAAALMRPGGRVRPASQFNGARCLGPRGGARVSAKQILTQSWGRACNLVWSLRGGPGRGKFGLGRERENGRSNSAMLRRGYCVQVSSIGAGWRMSIDQVG
jgi:hypothetical protein